MKKKLQTFIKNNINKEKLTTSKYLKVVQKYLHRHHLWDMQPKYAGRGAAIGVFWSFLIPVMQIPLSAISCIMLQGNLIVAVITTLPANPFTYPLLLYVYYETGKWIAQTFVFFEINNYITLTILGGTIFIITITPITYLIAYQISRRFIHKN